MNHLDNLTAAREEVTASSGVLTTGTTRHQATLSRECGCAIDGLPRETEHAVAMVLRDAVTSIVRHARLTRCRITVGHAEGRLVLQIEDDGRGGAVVEGAGIEGMRTRTREIGGTLEHRRGRGLTVTLLVPWTGPR